MKTQFLVLLVAFAALLMPSCVQVPMDNGMPGFAIDSNRFAGACMGAVMGALPPAARSFVSVSQPRYRTPPPTYNTGYGCGANYGGASYGPIGYGGHSVYNRPPSYARPNPAWDARFGPSWSTPRPRSVPYTCINGRFVRP